MRGFLLPTAAAHLLSHPDFAAHDAAVMQATQEGNAHIQFRSGPHLFIARTIEERKAIPTRAFPPIPTGMTKKALPPHSASASPRVSTSLKRIPRSTGVRLTIEWGFICC